MGGVDLNKPVTRWTFYKLALLMWIVKLGFMFLDWFTRTSAWMQKTYVGKKMQQFFDFVQPDLWNELLLPVCLVIFLVAGLWVANDCSFVLPHYEP